MITYPVAVKVITSSIGAPAFTFGTVVPSSLRSGSMVSLDMLPEVTLVLVAFATVTASLGAIYPTQFSSGRESASRFASQVHGRVILGDAVASSAPALEALIWG